MPIEETLHWKIKVCANALYSHFRPKHIYHTISKRNNPSSPNRNKQSRYVRENHNPSSLLIFYLKFNTDILTKRTTKRPLVKYHRGPFSWVNEQFAEAKGKLGQ